MGENVKKRGKSRRREVKPKLPTNLKLLVAQAPFEERAFVNEVAEVLEEILQAAENGFSRLPPRDESRVGNIINRVKLEEERKKIEEQKLKEARDEKLRKHHSQLRKEMERSQREKLMRDEEQNKKILEERKRELEKQQRREEGRQKYLEAQKRKLEQKKQQELEELKAKTEVEEKKKRALSEKQSKEKKEFLKNQKSKLRKEFEERVKERQALANLESELEYQKEIKKKKIMENMVNYLKDHKEDKEIELKQREDINKFYHKSRYIFEANESEINKVFKHYSKQNATTIDEKLLNNVNTIDMQEFVKFGTNTKIVPQLLNHDTLLHIFRVLAKERMENAGPDDELGLVLDMESFQKALILIAIEGREILGGSLKPKADEEDKYTSRYQLKSSNRSRDRNESSKSPEEKKPQKTLAGKKIKELKTQRPKYDTKIKDIKIGKHFDVTAISSETLKSLISSHLSIY